MINKLISEHRWIIMTVLLLLIWVELHSISSKVDEIWDFTGSIYDNSSQIKDYSEYSYSVLEDIKKGL